MSIVLRYFSSNADPLEILDASYGWYIGNENLTT